MPRAHAHPWNSEIWHEGRGLTREHDHQLGGSGSKFWGGGGGGGFFTAVNMVNKMVLARTPAPNLEEKLKEFLNSDRVSSIDFVLSNKEDKTSRTTFISTMNFTCASPGGWGRM